MKISRRIHQRLRLQSLLATVALLALLCAIAWLTSRYTAQTDWTINSRNSLTEQSKKLLDKLPGSIEITAYIEENKALRNKIKQLLQRYVRYKPEIQVTFIDPASNPEKMRELGIGKEGTVTVEYRGRTENLNVINESALTNALLRSANASNRWVTFLTGHGERSPNGKANHDLSLFGKDLELRNIKVVTLNLSKIPAIPENSSVLILAGPRVPMLDGELEIILDYIEKGGNLLWLIDPDYPGPQVLTDQLGIEILPGTIIDTNSQLYGVDDPSFVIVSEYNPHDLTKNLTAMTVYPIASALEMNKNSDFQATPILTSVPRSWTETGPISGTIRFDAGSNERYGPLSLGFALTRETADGKQQRIIVIGDGDFLSNTYIGNVGNRDMGLRIVNWLTHDDRFIDIPPKSTIDRQLQLSRPTIAVMAFGFLIILPVLLIGGGLLIWRKRKRS